MIDCFVRENFKIHLWIFTISLSSTHGKGYDSSFEWILIPTNKEYFVLGLAEIETYSKQRKLSLAFCLSKL